MEMIKVESSNIESIGHNNNTLYVTYLNGLQYEYSDVPKEVFENLLKSDSKGRFMNNNIKPNYKCRRITA